jgi:hypothetical protein
MVITEAIGGVEMINKEKLTYEYFSEAEKLTYECLLKDLREAKTNERAYHLDKIEKFISIINIKLNKAIPEGWEIP